MSNFEINILTLLAKGVFVLISTLCLASMLKDALAEKGWRSARPVLIWLAWGLVTFICALLIMLLANAHTHVSEATLAIRIITMVYLVTGMALVVKLAKRLK